MSARASRLHRTIIAQFINESWRCILSPARELLAAAAATPSARLHCAYSPICVKLIHICMYIYILICCKCERALLFTFMQPDTQQNHNKYARDEAPTRRSAHAPDMHNAFRGHVFSRSEAARDRERDRESEQRCQGCLCGW